jgi:hypothetical protein
VCACVYVCVCVCLFILFYKFYFRGLRKDIQERDETITEKEKRIYDLKRKNQVKYFVLIQYKNVHFEISKKLKKLILLVNIFKENYT